MVRKYGGNKKMKINEMDEREFNRFNNLFGQAEKIYADRTNSYRTEVAYKGGMEQFCKYLAVETKINNTDNFKAKHVIGFVQQMKAEGLSASTQKNYLAAIRDYADRAGIDQRTIPANSRLELEKRSFGNVDRTWTNREFTDFKEVSKAYDSDRGNGPRMELILDTARYFGCRIEGILNLDLNSINKALNTGELWTKEKNGKMNIKPVETAYQKEILQKIKALGEENKQNKIFVVDNFKTAYKEVQNFITNSRGEIQDRDRIKTTYARNVYKETGEVQKGNLTAHGLRHTYLQEQVKNYVEQGYSLKDACLKVSKLAGHTREEVTKIYLASAK